VKRVLIKIKTMIKIIILVGISMFLILGGVTFCYNPIYSVSRNGEFLGYTSNKSELQKKINEYTTTGDGTNKNLAFVQIDEMPEYKLCLLKKDIKTNDDEIFQKVVSTGVTYYRYYAIAIKEDEKLYLSDIQTAEAVISGLKEKNSNNINSLMIIEKYEKEIKDFTSKDDAIAKLYEKKVVKKVTVAKAKGTIKPVTGVSNAKVSLGGLKLINPTAGVVTSRFATKSSFRTSSHKGLDIGAPIGTKIVAAAAGTVTYSGYNSGGYGNLVIINHGNGIETYYAHCNTLSVSYGSHVSQGQKIATVGNTGRSTGPHLHLEVRVNGVVCNPQNYVY